MTIDGITSRRRAADQLVAHFEDRILSGDMPEGTTLPPEREIVNDHGVSRTVVREAVLALANKGLVTAKPGYRPVVAKPGYDSAIEVVSSLVSKLLNQQGGVRNLFDLRIMMEVALVREAAVNATRNDIQKLKAALEANGAAIDNSEEFYQTDIAFHNVFFSAPGNPLLLSVHKAYTDWLAPQWRQMPRMPERNSTNFAAHTRIYEAILLRDPDAAEAALRDHLDDAWAQVSMTFEGL